MSHLDGSAENNISVLIIDDELSMREALGDCLRLIGIRAITEATNKNDAIAELMEGRYDAAFFDRRMETDYAGTEAALFASAERPGMARITMSVTPTDEHMEAGHKFINKGDFADLDLLRDTLLEALGMAALSEPEAR